MTGPLERDSLRGLLKRLGDDLIALIRSEVRLAGGEVRENLAQAAGAFTVLAIGLMLVSVGMFCLLGAMVVFLAKFTGLLAAALIVAAIATILGGIAIAVGITRLKSTELVPQRLAANLRQDADALKGD
ncbi:MAG: phage holin family protein [Sandarakinorhabdus sp.]|nr:phage holin family protein [Sandarakinorhabdus sp.]